jgi:hypothetical protein
VREIRVRQTRKLSLRLTDAEFSYLETEAARGSVSIGTVVRRLIGSALFRGDALKRPYDLGASPGSKALASSQERRARKVTSAQLPKKRKTRK